MTSAHISKGTIVAAVALDEHTDAVVAAAAALARRLDKALHIVHVVEEEPIQPWAFEVPAYFYYLPLSDGLEERARGARERLVKIVEASRMQGRARGEILVGEPAEALITYCKLHRASLLVTSRAAAYGGTSGFMSTTLALMAHAPLPVLVIEPGHPPDFERPGLSIMIADDLEAGSEEAVRRAFDLAMRLPANRVRLVHAHGNHQAPLPGEESFRERDHDARRLKLTARGQPFRGLLPASVPVEIDIREGAVGVELAAAVADFQPDILVFGRHKALKIRPFLIGKVPFRQMLKSSCAVLVVPPPKELYTAIAAPDARAP